MNARSFLPRRARLRCAAPLLVLLTALAAALFGASAAARAVPPVRRAHAGAAPVPARARAVLVASPSPSARAEPEQARPAARGPALRILLLGSDARAESPLLGRADTIMVLVLPEAGRGAGVISVPRDLLITPDDAPPHRLGETLAVARSTGEEPLERMRRVVEDTLLLPLDHVVLVSMAGFVRAVDALGGLPVEVPCPIEDDFIDPSAPGGRRRLSVESGVQHLDGATAAMYARSRHGRSDFGRSRRQQALLRALRARLTEPAGLTRLPAVLSAMSEATRSDLSAVELTRLAWELGQRDLRDVRGVVLGHEETRPARTDDGKAVLLGDPAAISARVDALFEAPAAGTPPRGAPCPPADVALRRDWDE